MKPPALTEAEFQRQVTDLAEILGWTWVHHRPAQTAHGWRTPVSGPLGKGWPDLIMSRGPRLLACELKAQGKKPTPEQVSVLTVLRDAGVETHVWQPSDFDEIQAALR
jgi:hypothetical protein